MTDPQPARLEIFLDGSNFYNGLRLQFGDGRYDLAKLAARIAGSRKLAAVNFYTGTLDARRQPQPAAAQRKFLASLKALPLPLRVFGWPMRYPKDWPKSPPQEKGIDAVIVQDMLIGAVDGRYDVAVLLSGDRDFIHVVRLLHDRFSMPLETYYPASRCHLYESARSCFSQAEVITRPFYDSVR